MRKGWNGGKVEDELYFEGDTSLWKGLMCGVYVGGKGTAAPTAGDPCVNTEPSGSGGVEKLAALATSLDLSKLALRILHNRWHECILLLVRKISTNHRPVFIYMNLAHNIFLTNILWEEDV